MILFLFLSVVTFAFPGDSQSRGNPPQDFVFSQAVSEFTEYREARLKTLSHSKHAPVLLTHGEKTEYAVILIHGLYESPRSLMGLAKVFHRQGMNVYMPLLPGHWNRNYRLADRTGYEDWLKEIDQSVKYAQKLGRKTLVAGFSLGGILGAYAVLKYPGQVRGLFVWSPAIGLSNKVGLAASLGNVLGFNGNDWEETPVDGLNVPYFSLHMAAQLPRLHNYMNRKLLGVSNQGGARNTHQLFGWDVADKIQVPTFVSYSEGDEAISRYQVRKFFSYLRVPKTMVVFQDIKHTATPKSKADANPLRPYEYNPKFGDIVRSLEKFIAKNF